MNGFVSKLVLVAVLPVSWMPPSAAHAESAKPLARASAAASAEPSAAPTTSPAPAAVPSIAPTSGATSETSAVSNGPTIRETLADPDVRPLLTRKIAQLAKVSWMTGTWRASHVRVAGQASHATTTTYVFAYTMNGRWLFGADGSAANFFYLTYDPFSERWVLARLESAPSYGLWTSDGGWRAGRIAFVGNIAYVAGRPYRRRLTIVRRSKRRMDVIAEEQTAGGAWLTDETIVMNKQS